MPTRLYRRLLYSLNDITLRNAYYCGRQQINERETDQEVFLTGAIFLKNMSDADWEEETLERRLFEVTLIDGIEDESD